MAIETQSSNSLFIRLTHSSSNSLALAVGTVLTFVISSAQAQTTVNLSIQAETPSGAVMAFNLPACPTGWSELDGTGGRPDIRGRTIVAEGQGVGLTNRTLGDSGGAESHTLTIAQMPIHTHNSSVKAFSDEGNSGSPTDSYFASTPAGFSSIANGYDTAMAPDAVEIASAGAGLPHNIMQPYLVLKYCQKN